MLDSFVRALTSRLTATIAIIESADPPRRGTNSMARQQWQSKAAGSLFKDWKPWAVIILLTWSLWTLIKVEPRTVVEDWTRLSQMSPDALSEEIQQRLKKEPNYKTMNDYEKEDFIKHE